MFPLSISRVEISVKSKKLLGPINLVINEKGITVVLGANGSGKTTLLEALHGLRKSVSYTHLTLPTKRIV